MSGTTFDAFAAYIGALREQRVSEPFALAFAAIKADDRKRLNELLAHHPRLVNAAGTNGNRLLPLAMSLVPDDPIISVALPEASSLKFFCDAPQYLQNFINLFNSRPHCSQFLVEWHSFWPRSDFTA